MKNPTVVNAVGGTVSIRNNILVYFLFQALNAPKFSKYKHVKHADPHFNLPIDLLLNVSVCNELDMSQRQKDTNPVWLDSFRSYRILQRKFPRKFHREKFLKNHV